MNNICVCVFFIVLDALMWQLGHCDPADRHPKFSLFVFFVIFLYQYYHVKIPGPSILGDTYYHF